MEDNDACNGNYDHAKYKADHNQIPTSKKRLDTNHNNFSNPNAFEIEQPNTSENVILLLYLGLEKEK